MSPWVSWGTSRGGGDGTTTGAIDGVIAAGAGAGSVGGVASALGGGETSGSALMEAGSFLASSCSVEGRGAVTGGVRIAPQLKQGQDRGSAAARLPDGGWDPVVGGALVRVGHSTGGQGGLAVDVGAQHNSWIREEMPGLVPGIGEARRGGWCVRE